MPAKRPKFNQFTYHEEVALRIERMTPDGEGEAHSREVRVRVGFVLPGELVRARIWSNVEGEVARADLIEVVEPSAARIGPKCPLFGICAGCQYQHLPYAPQLELKRAHLAEIYRAAGIEIEPGPMLASPREWAYRTKLTPHYAAVRAPRPDEDASGFNDFPIGFLRVGRKEIVEVAACPIATDAINAALPSAYGALRARKAEVKKDGTLNFRESVAEDGAISVITDFNSPAFEEVNSVRYEFISGEFFQVNRSILADFSDYVLSGVVTPYLVDAYCGVGFFALQAARKCQRVWGVEVSKVAVESAQRNARANQIENVEFVEGSAEAIFENITAPAVETTVLMDPSRKGATEAFLDQLLGFGPARIVYVACSPETQARDVRYLIERGYRLSSLRGADLFPQTRHIEGIALLERK